MPRTYTLTYDCVTPESAEDGGTSDHGFGDGASLTSVSLADMEAERGDMPRDEWLKLLKEASDANTDTIEPLDAAELERHRFKDEAPESAQSRYAVATMAALIRDHYGATEPSSVPYSPGTWYTTPDGSTDYRTGEVTRVSVHLDGWTDDEQRAIYAAVTRR